MHISKSILTLAMIAVSAPTIARDTFELDLNIDGKGSGALSFSSAEEALNQLDSQGLEQLVSSYITTDTGVATLDFRGIETIVRFPSSGSEIILSIPEIEFDKTFQGADRDASRDELESFLENNGEGILKELLQALSRETPVDPVAGNPNSLMSRMGSSSFEQGSSISGQKKAAQGQHNSSANRIGLEARLGRHSAGDFEQDSITVPIKYDVVFDNPRYRLKFDAPLTVIDTNGTKTYNGSFGIGFQFPVNNKWSLTPGVRIGAVGSADAASAAIVNSASLTSNYDIYLGDTKLSIANNGSYFKTQSIDAGDYSIDYDLKNWMTKNGIGLEGYSGFNIFGVEATWQTNLSHTQIFGDPLFIESYVEAAASFGTVEGGGFLNDLRIGATFKKALDEDYNAVLVNFGYAF